MSLLALGTRFYSQALEGFLCLSCSGMYETETVPTGVPEFSNSTEEHAHGASESPISNEANGNR